MDTARLRVFLGEHYRSVIEHTCEEALSKAFAANGLRQAAVAEKALVGQHHLKSCTRSV